MADHRLGPVGAARALPDPPRSPARPTSSTRCSRSASASRCCSPRRRTPCASTSTCAGCAAAAPRPTPTPASGRSPTIAVGALGGLLVGITSVGSGSVIMIALLMLYPGLSAVRLVGTDLVQAVPLVMAAAISNIALNGLDWHILIPLVIGSVPGTHPRQPDRAAGAAVVHPPRHRDRADDVGARAARQVRLGAARRRRGRDPPGPDRPGRPRRWSWCCRWSGACSGAPRGCRCSARPRSPSSRARRPRRAAPSAVGAVDGAADDQSQVP